MDIFGKNWKKVTNIRSERCVVYHSRYKLIKWFLYGLCEGKSTRRGRNMGTVSDKLGILKWICVARN